MSKPIKPKKLKDPKEKRGRPKRSPWLDMGKKSDKN